MPISDDDVAAVCDQVNDIVERIRPMLARQGQPVQVFVVARLAAMFIAGHVTVNELYQPPHRRPETDEMRRQKLEDLIELIQAHIPICERTILSEMQFKRDTPS